MATALDGTGDLRAVDPAAVIRRTSDLFEPVDATSGEGCRPAADPVLLGPAGPASASGSPLQPWRLRRFRCRRSICLRRLAPLPAHRSRTRAEPRRCWRPARSRVVHWCFGWRNGAVEIARWSRLTVVHRARHVRRSRSAARSVVCLRGPPAQVSATNDRRLRVGSDVRNRRNVGEKSKARTSRRGWGDAAPQRLGLRRSGRYSCYG
jgi:hypothetical protein